MDIKSISLQSISIDFIPEYQLLWVSCYFICLIGQIKVYYRIKRVVINEVELCAAVVIILSHTIGHQIVEDPYF